MGLDGGTVRRLGSAWVSEVPTRPVRATVERIRAHDAVVAAALETGSTPLPARFGQTYASDDECEQAISAKLGELSAALARVSGMVEMRLLLRAADAPAPDRASGTAYLESLSRRARAEEEVRRVAREVNEALRAHVRDAAVSTQGPVTTLAHLVEREARHAYRDRVEAVMRGMTGIEATLVGPTAPYAFGQAE